MRALALVGLAAVAVGNTACWEQWSPSWFPQMKRQPAGQAFEDTGVPGHPQGFTPPEGTLPTYGLATPATSVVDDGSRVMETIPDDVADGLVNSVPSDLRSLTQGRAIFSITFDHYAEVPDHVAKKVIEAAHKANGANEHH